MSKNSAAMSSKAPATSAAGGEIGWAWPVTARYEVVDDVVVVVTVAAESAVTA